MNRRDFLKVVLSSSLAAPLFPSTKTSASSVILYLISDDPQLFLPPIIEELERKAWVKERRFALLNQHPFGKELKGALSTKGWRYVLKPSGSNLRLSFEPLHHAAAPSFALIREGRIWDIRGQNLSRLWQEMNSHGGASTCLTVASFEERPFASAPGKSAAISVDGKKREFLSLSKNQRRRISTRDGEVVVGIDGGRAKVLASTCRHKICLSSPPAFLAGDRIICAPRRFLLEIEGTRFVDTVTG